MRARIALSLAALCLCCATILSAQDPTKVDSKHYTAVSDNAYSRIVKAHYEPHEKSVMHSHPDLVAVFLTDGKVKFTYADGKTEERTVKAGDAILLRPPYTCRKTSATRHLTWSWLSSKRKRARPRPSRQPKLRGRNSVRQDRFIMALSPPGGAPFARQAAQMAQ